MGFTLAFHMDFSDLDEGSGRLPKNAGKGTSTAFRAYRDRKVHAAPHVLGGIDSQVAAV